MNEESMLTLNIRNNSQSNNILNTITNNIAFLFFFFTRCIWQTLSCIQHIETRTDGQNEWKSRLYFFFLFFFLNVFTIMTMQWFYLSKQMRRNCFFNSSLSLFHACCCYHIQWDGHLNVEVKVDISNRCVDHRIIRFFLSWSR